MNAVSELMLFTAALVLSAVIVLSFIPTTNRAGDVGVAATKQLASQAAFCIESVYSDGKDTNIYVYGVSQSYKFQPRVYVDGQDVNVISYGLLKDKGGDGYLDAGDLGYVEINGDIFDRNLHDVEVWLGTDRTHVRVLMNGDSGNCT